jgi:hypothetical protein
MELSPQKVAEATAIPQNLAVGGRAFGVKMMRNHIDFVYISPFEDDMISSFTRRNDLHSRPNPAILDFPSILSSFGCR